MALTRLGLNQAVNLATNVTGTLATGNGGTGATSFAPGKVLQIVQAQKDGLISTSSTSYVTTNLSASITPSATDSKVLILANMTACLQATQNKNGFFTIYRASTNIAPGGSGLYQQLSGIYSASGGSITPGLNMSFLDSPSSSSSTTYTVYMATDSGGDQRMNQNGTSSVIQLLEIGA
tara:strand:+ start:268 stop:801 length:534 start_codon:yes stop_codon:yes gene_type:complete